MNNYRANSKSRKSKSQNFEVQQSLFTSEELQATRQKICYDDLNKEILKNPISMVEWIKSREV